ncbi:MAG TPA: hypothetical protein VGI95_03955 [Caulobacteraceae bacterium]
MTDQSLLSSSTERTSPSVQAWTPPGRALTPENTGLVQGAIRTLDAWLRAKQGFVEYSTSPSCVLRVVVVRADSYVELSDGSVIEPGQTILDIHFWNERMPQSADCPGLGWGGRFGRQLVRSLVDLAQALDADPRLKDAVALRGRLAFSGARDAEDMHRFAHWFGFERASSGHVPLLRRLHDGIEDVWLLALAWTFNPGSLRSRAVLRRRGDLWISKRKLVERYVAHRPRRAAS